MKGLTTLVALFLAGLSAFAGDFREATPTEAADILALVELSPSELGSLSCDFVQTRHTSMLQEDLVTRGHLSIDSGKTLVWEQRSPRENRMEIDLESDRRTQALSRKNDFSRKVYVSEKEYKIELVPLKRDMKQIFTKIEAYVERSTGNVARVEMTDSAGDTTLIEFSNVKR